VQSGADELVLSDDEKIDITILQPKAYAEERASVG
jgi:hypothetical protein